MRTLINHSWLQRLKRPSFRSKLLLSYALLVTVPIAIMGSKYYYSSRKFVEDFSKENVYSIVKQNNELIDAELARIEDSSLAMMADQSLYDQYLNANSKDEYRMVTMEKNVMKAMNKYFPDLTQIYSFHLMTSYSDIGTSTFIPYQEFYSTALYQAAMESDGAMKWIPTFALNDMFSGNYGDTVPVGYSDLLSGVRLLKLFQMNNGDITELRGKAELPVLVVTYKPDLYASQFSSTLPSDGASFFITSPQGYLVSSSDKQKIATRYTPEWLDVMNRMESGTITVIQNGKPMIVCFDTSPITGWISGITISPERLMNSFLPEIESYTFYLGFLLLLISLFFAYIFAESITRPIQQLLKAIKKTGDGEFDTRIPIDQYNEMGYLIHKYNQMNVKINHLIEENYIVKLREKESQIMSLNIQLNPHFLYNTLNIMNWTALENHQKELSRMIVSLSSMLQYTSENHQDIGDFREDMNWLRCYIYITDQRFEGKFTLTYDIAPELYDYTVPKLFLQPFVENAIVHGFAHIHSGGLIHIRGWIEGDKRCFIVQDNGKGIPKTRMAELHRMDSDSIGIRNVDKRIKLIYGDCYGIELDSEENEGTTVKITMPL